MYKVEQEKLCTSHNLCMLTMEFVNFEPTTKNWSKKTSRYYQLVALKLRSSEKVKRIKVGL